MGKYLGKCERVVGEIAVVGVRTRARAAVAMATVTSSLSSLSPKKIRKAAATTRRCNVRHRRFVVASKQNSVSSSSNFLQETTSSSSDVVVVGSATPAANASSGEVSSDCPSCCSSNNASSSNEMAKDRFEIMADPEQVESAQPSSRHLHCRIEARKESKLRGARANKLDSPPRIVDAKSTVQIKMPSDTEIEEFFAASEKDLHKRFADKYNFDVVKDIPLKGRYEWVSIKP